MHHIQYGPVVIVDNQQHTVYNRLFPSYSKIYPMNTVDIHLDWMIPYRYQ